MRIELNIYHEDIFAFLTKKGYEIKPYLHTWTDAAFPSGVTQHEKYTFTATKEGQAQSEETIFHTVFEKEVKEMMKF